MLNRSSFLSRSRPAITVIMVAVIGNCVLSPPSAAFPVQRGSFSLLDRLIRSNPLRTLANLLNRNRLSMNMYYPNLQPQPQPLHYPHMGMPGTALHYVKMPTAVQPLYYSSPPPAKPLMTSMAMLPPIPRQPVQLPQPPPQYFLHGVTYPVMNVPQQHPQQIFIQPAVSTYNLAGQVQIDPPRQSTLVGQYDQNYLLPSPSPSPALTAVEPVSLLSQVETPPPALPVHYKNDNDLTSQKAETANQLEVQLPSPIEYSTEVHTNKNGNSAAQNPQLIKIVVINPSDLQKMRNLEKELSTAEISTPSHDMVKGYTMKYDNEDGSDAEILLDSNSQNAPESNAISKESCYEPMCDPFLRKLIPELLASSTTFQHDTIDMNVNRADDPIVIVKSDNDTVIPVDYSVAYLNGNEKLPSNEEQITLFEQSTSEPLHTEQSSVQPARVHFPRRRLSAKINSTLIRKFDRSPLPSLSAEKENSQTLNSLEGVRKKLRGNYFRKHFISTTSARSVEPLHSETESDVITSSNLMQVPTPRIFGPERSYPRYRYGSSAARLKLKKTSNGKMQYSAGVVFNKKAEEGLKSES